MVTILTSQDCQACNRVKHYLKTNDIPFVEHDINKDMTLNFYNYVIQRERGLPIVINHRTLEYFSGDSRIGLEKLKSETKENK